MEKERKITMTKVIAVDFDGTLCENEFPEIGAPNWPVITAAKAEQEKGAKIILWTCRTGKELEEAVAAAKGWGLTFDAVNENLPERIEMFGNDPRKIGADEYWDDRSVTLLNVMMRSFNTLPESLRRDGKIIADKPVICTTTFTDEEDGRHWFVKYTCEITEERFWEIAEEVTTDENP